MDLQSLFDSAQECFIEKDFNGFIEAIRNIAALPPNTSISLEKISLIVIGVEKFIYATVGELRTLNLIHDQEPQDVDVDHRIAVLNDELRIKCEQCDSMIHKLIEKAQSDAGRFSLTKLRADVGFYCCQVSDIDNSDIVRDTEQLYQLSWSMALQISPASTDIMCTEVNHSVFLMEVKKDRNAAIRNVETALEQLEKEEECEAVKCALLFLLQIWMEQD